MIEPIGYTQKILIALFSNMIEPIGYNYRCWWNMPWSKNPLLYCTYVLLLLRLILKLNHKHCIHYNQPIRDYMSSFKSSKIWIALFSDMIEPIGYIQKIFIALFSNMIEPIGYNFTFWCNMPWSKNPSPYCTYVPLLFNSFWNEITNIAAIILNPL